MSKTDVPTKARLPDTLVRRDEVVRILSDLIAFESVSHRSNLPIIEYIGEVLKAEGIAFRLLPNEAGDKAALIATIGPADRPGIALSAHTDVVPVEGQNWSSDPFRADIRDGRLYGRGSSDMKGFLALVLAHVLRFREAATEVPVHLAFSYDEEVGCAGADDLVAAVKALPVPPALCIVGEPTSMRVARAHKGKFARRLIVTGRGGHSALPHRAANAVEAAARLAVALSDLGMELRAITDDAFDPPWTSIHVGSLHGGGALNFVPDRAVIEFEARTIPGTDAAVLQSHINVLIENERTRLKAQAPEADILVETISAYPGLDTPTNSAAVRLGSALAGYEAAAITIAFGTEAGLYDEAGVPTIVCGPGDIARAHKADEWIGLDELNDGIAMMERIAQRLSSPLT